MIKKEIPQSVRKEVLERDNHQCVECKGTDRLEIHHVLPEKFGGQTTPNNLIAICRECHSSKHIEYQTKYYDMFIFKFRNFLRKVLGKPLKKNIKPLLFLLTNQDKFRPCQENVIEDVLSGKDVLFVSPTGSGKSICFQIPGIMLENESLVITPLKALMKDQVEGLWKRRVPATYINSDIDMLEKRKRISLILKNLFQFIYVAPEQFYAKLNDYQLKIDHQLFGCKYDLFVVDEAHCIDKWGRNFRPSYAKLREIRETLGKPRTIALTASASKRVQKNIIDSLDMRNPSVYVTGFYRSEIELSGIIFNGDKDKIIKQKTDFIYKCLTSNIGKKIIIFVPTVNIGNRLRDVLIDKGVKTAFFYGKLNIDDKTRIQNEYKGIIKSNLKVLICTSAFGMGINIPDIRLAIHWTIPENIEDYYQQMGRVGRDRKQSKAVLLYGNGDEGLIRYINQKSLENSPRKLSEIDRARIESLVEEELKVMINYVNSSNKWQYILDYFGETILEKKQYKNNFYWYCVIVIIVWIFSKSLIIAIFLALLTAFIIEMFNNK